MHFTTVVIILVAGLLAGACDSALAPAGRRVPGILEWDARPSITEPASLWDATTGPSPRPGVVAPDSVRAGATFAATVTTVGPTICWEAAGAVVEQEGSLATVTPYDRTREDEDTGCGDAVIELPRRVELRFTQPGEALLRVRGRRVIGRELQEADQMVVLEKRIQVR